MLFPSATLAPDSVLKQAHDKLTREARRIVVAGSPEDQAATSAMRATLERLFDYPELSRLSLGPAWDTLSEPKRAELVALQRRLVENKLIAQMRGQRGYVVTYRTIRIEGDLAVVSTTIKQEAAATTAAVPIEYRMRKQARGWVVYDAVADGVSTAEDYRAQFDEILERNSFDALLERLRRAASDITVRGHTR